MHSYHWYMYMQLHLLLNIRILNILYSLEVILSYCYRTSDRLRKCRENHKIKLDIRWLDENGVFLSMKTVLRKQQYIVFWMKNISRVSIIICDMVICIYKKCISVLWSAENFNEMGCNPLWSYFEKKNWLATYNHYL
jgi:hypothetical protein